MLAYKGFNADLTCTCGRGTFQYEIGKTIKESKSKCRNSGAHCAEYPLECLRWYPLGCGNRYFLVEASGSLDELGGTDTQLACTEITLLKELSLKELAGRAMMYMVKHPLREWEVNMQCCSVRKDKAEARNEGSMAIARGPHPKVKGAAGSVLGLIREVNGGIEEARLFEVNGNIKPNTWYTLEGREPKEAEG